MASVGGVLAWMRCQVSEGFDFGLGGDELHE